MIAMFAVALIGAVDALGSGIYDFEDYPASTVTITNNTPRDVTVSAVSYTYDSPHQTNTLTIYRTFISGGVTNDFLIAEEASSDAQYDLEADDFIIKPGQVWKIVSSATSDLNAYVEDDQ